MNTTKDSIEDATRNDMKSTPETKTTRKTKIKPKGKTKSKINNNAITNTTLHELVQE